MARPNYSIDFQSITVAGVGVVKGQAVTNMGAYWAPASTVNLASSVSGGYDGVALATVSAGVFPFQCDGVVPADVTGLGTGVAAFCNVDSGGNLTRSSTSDDTTIGRVRKDGSVALTLGSQAGGGLSAGTKVGQTVKWTGSAWANQLGVVVDPRDYTTDVLGTPGVDATPAITLAYADALTSTTGTSFPNYRGIVLPAGSVELSEPIRIYSSFFDLGGAGYRTVVRTGFNGPAIVNGPSLGDVPPVVSGGPFGGNCFIPNQGRDYTIPLRMCGCGEVDWARTLCIEAWVYPTATISGGSTVPIAASSGLERAVTNIWDTAFMLAIVGSGIDGVANTAPFCIIRVGNQNYVLSGLTSLSLNTWHHIMLLWDGSTLNLCADGVVLRSIGTVARGIRQEPWEGVKLAAASGMREEVLYGPVTSVKIGPTRGTISTPYAISGSAYTVPTGPFPLGGFGDRWVINWDTVLEPTGDVVKGSYGGTGDPATAIPVWFPVVGDKGLLNTLDTIRIHDMSFEGTRGVRCGAVYTNQVLHLGLSDLKTTLCLFQFYSRNNSFESSYRNLTHSGLSGEYAGFINFTTAGDVWENCNSQLSGYPYLLGGSQTLIGCTVGQWSIRCAGMALRDGVVELNACFWDAESQVDPTRGAVFADGCKLKMTGCLVSGGSFIDQPPLTLDGSDADIEYSTQSAPFFSGFVDVLSPAPNFIRLRGVDYGTPDAYALTSSTDAAFGRVLVEASQGADALIVAWENKGKTEHRHGAVDTLTDHAAQAIGSCGVELDPYSRYDISFEVQGDSSDGTSGATWKIAECWTRGDLASAPALAYTVSSTSAGTSAGAVPANWAASLVSDGTSVVYPTVQSPSGTAASFDCNVVATRVQRSVASWTPAELAPSAWFRGDVGTTASWTDQSGNGNDAPAGATAPTTTTLAGQAAFASGSAGSFKNTAANLVTAGQSYTVLAVLQANDLVGGSVFSQRTTLDCASSQLYTVGTTYYVSSAGTGNTTTDHPIADEISTAPALVEWSYYLATDGSGARYVRSRINRYDRSCSGAAGVETGSTGFEIFTDAHGTHFNGKIAELVIVPRAITATERKRWEDYVLGRYSI